ncbi:MAG: hypothetical protein DHS20C17_18630 [Cyclobacteriaceae bacterium]|nr:MAG: hypothetical protein DHS20C17_18630 [Cyclobacteriaceae bacterium]
MDVNEIQSRLKELRERCIDNFVNNFNEFVLRDYHEAGFEGIFYIIDDESYYEYWLHQAFNLKYVMSWISEIEEEELMDELFLEFITIKKVVDSKLLELETLENIYIDLGETKPEETPIPRIELNSAVIHVGKALKRLHSGLSDVGLIQESLNEFKKHFLQEMPDFKPIVWFGKVVQIVALFSRLRDKKLLMPSKANSVEEIILNHFVKNNHQPFSKGSIKVNKTNLSTRDSDYPEINTIISNLEM